MKQAYPVIFTRDGDDYLAYVPDFNIDTQGHSLAEAIEMARDAIGLMGIVMEDDKKPLPKPSEPRNVKHDNNEIVSMVDIDFEAYRKANSLRIVRRNVSLPSWLNCEAEKAGLNLSAILQKALKQALNIEE